MTLTLFAVATVIALRLYLFYTGNTSEGADLMLVHFLAIVTLVFFTGHQMLAKDPRTRFPDLMRNGFRNAAVYSLIMGIFLFIFFTWINVDEFPRMIDERVKLLMAEGKTEAEAYESISSFFNPFNYASISFFSLLAVSVFNALLIAVIHHKVLRRFIR